MNTIKLASAILVFGLLSIALRSSDSSSKTSKDTRKLLSQMQDRHLNSDRLAVLFRIGDERITDLIQLLDDPDQDISLRAQVVIRYLGNELGMKALREWYGKQKHEYRIAGPVPLPLSDWDYNFVRSNLLTEPPQAWRDRAVEYIYALALDGSSSAKAVLDEIIKKAEKLDETSFVKHAIKRVQGKLVGKPLTEQKDLVKMVRDNAFFVDTVDRRYTSVRILSFNASRDKVLAEIHINRGPLAEEWYHVVISKSESGWKFFSIDPVAIS
jgi:hypothetical protein